MISIPFISRLAVLLPLLLSAIFLAPAAQARYAALVIDADSGEVLYEANARDYRRPASLTKMMTLYMVFDAIERGRINLHQPLWVSAYAASRPPSKLGLQPGESITVEEAIYALVTLSANDAAAVIGEALGGTEFRFAQQMTQRAHRLGMTQTFFSNASGLPDPYQVTTAWDMFKLAQALQRDFPHYYPYFSATDFYFRNRLHRNHNHLLYDYQGTDGIKTGYVRESGYNLVASVRRSGRRLIGIVFGGNSPYARDAHMRAILDQGFAKLDGGSPVYVAAPPFSNSFASDPVEPVVRVKPVQAIAQTARPVTLTKLTRQVKVVKHTSLAKSVNSAKSIKQLKLIRIQSAKSVKPGKQTKVVKLVKPAAVAKSSRLAKQSAKQVKLAKLTEPPANSTKSPANSTKSSKQKAAGASKAVKQIKSVKPVEPVKPSKPAKAGKPAKSAKPMKQAANNNAKLG